MKRLLLFNFYVGFYVGFLLVQNTRKKTVPRRHIPIVDYYAISHLFVYIITYTHIHHSHWYKSRE